jgi:hypothetical protein
MTLFKKKESLLLKEIARGLVNDYDAMLSMWSALFSVRSVSSLCNQTRETVRAMRRKEGSESYQSLESRGSNLVVVSDSQG